ncbi:hypothetical protein FQN57_001167 [Myotisia sp. PD_48]|nr:hypothetical protein FQN57_001167 [Myotisia sp. PD_48]
MNPYLSWAILLFVAGGLGFYYSKGQSYRARSGVSRSVTEKQDQLAANKKPKRKARRLQDAPNENDTITSTTRQDAVSVTTPPIPLLAEPVNGSPSPKEMNNIQFAREFSKARNGTALGANNQGAAKRSPPRESSHSVPRSSNEKQHGLSTSASSTTGADADDDMSPVSSPSAKPMVLSGSVSDMLAPPPQAASVLRLTGEIESEFEKKQKKRDNFKTVETKKQRQQRLKRENTRQMVQEAEAQRRAQLEKHLHTARGHERQEKAKSKANANSPLAENAWASGLPKPTANGQAIPLASQNTFLDTFDTAPGPVSVSHGSTSNGNTAPPYKAIVQSWANGLPSEEEQMRMLSAMSSKNEWTTVGNKKKEKRKTKSGDTVSETSSSDAQRGNE